MIHNAWQDARTIRRVIHFFFTVASVSRSMMQFKRGFLEAVWVESSVLQWGTTFSGYQLSPEPLRFRCPTAAVDLFRTVSARLRRHYFKLEPYKMSLLGRCIDAAEWTPVVLANSVIAVGNLLGEDLPTMVDMMVTALIDKERELEQKSRVQMLCEGVLPRAIVNSNWPRAGAFKGDDSVYVVLPASMTTPGGGETLVCSNLIRKGTPMFLPLFLFNAILSAYGTPPPGVIKYDIDDSPPSLERFVASMGLDNHYVTHSCISCSYPLTPPDRLDCSAPYCAVAYHRGCAPACLKARRGRCEICCLMEALMFVIHLDNARDSGDQTRFARLTHLWGLCRSMGDFRLVVSTYPNLCKIKLKYALETMSLSVGDKVRRLETPLEGADNAQTGCSKASPLLTITCIGNEQVWCAPDQVLDYNTWIIKDGATTSFPLLVYLNYS